MRILIAHKFYHPGGGDSKCAMQQEHLLKSKGHEVAVFSMSHPQNHQNPWSIYWPSSVDYSQPKWTNVVKKLSRPLYSSEVNSKFNRIIQEFSPNVIHVHNIHSQLSPLIVQIAYTHKIPVIWTLHDYKLLCPVYTCLRNGNVCEECTARPFSVVRHRCLKNNLSASLLAFLEYKYWSPDRLVKYTSRFIAPSQFLKDKILSVGISEEQVDLVPNFILQQYIRPPTAPPKKQYCYLGRLSQEKGLETLLRAASNLPNYQLKIIGDGPIRKRLALKYGALEHVEFLGYQKWEAIKKIISESRCTVVPSEWYENNPLSIIESFALGTPVIGAEIGGIPELIRNGETGYTFQAGNVEDLKNKVKRLMEGSNLEYMAKQAINYVQKNSTQEVYYRKLMAIYKEVSGT